MTTSSRTRWATGRFDKWATLLLYRMRRRRPSRSLCRRCAGPPRAAAPTARSRPWWAAARRAACPCSLGTSLAACAFTGSASASSMGALPEGGRTRSASTRDDARKSAGIVLLGGGGQLGQLCGPVLARVLHCLWCSDIDSTRCRTRRSSASSSFPSPSRACSSQTCEPRREQPTFPDVALAWRPLGIDIDHVDEDKNDSAGWAIPAGALRAHDVRVWRVAAREKIEEQMASFSIAKAECFDERDRPRIEQVIAQWFGERAAGIKPIRTPREHQAGDLVSERRQLVVGSSAPRRSSRTRVTRTPFIAMMSWQARAIDAAWTRTDVQRRLRRPSDRLRGRSMASRISRRTARSCRMVSAASCGTASRGRRASR